MFAMTFKLGKSLEKFGEEKSKLIKKSMTTAMKREGFLLSGQLKREIRQGAPGGKSYPGLSTIARQGYSAKTGKWRFTSRKPFTGIGGRGGRLPGKIIPIRYNYEQKGNTGSVQVGLVDTRKEKMSKSWKRIFMIQQEGFSSRIDKYRKKSIARRGGELGKRSKLRRHFFLKKGTNIFKTPARPVIDPFWEKWNQRSLSRMSDNFHKKMDGKRI